MGILKENDVMDGVSGRFGRKIVFRNLKNQTIASRRPVRKKTLILSDSQKTVRDKFRNASAYAKAVVTDPELKAAYQAKVREKESAYNVAFRDAQSGPEFMNDHHDLSEYTGLPGQAFRIKVVDNFRVVSLKVTIYDGQKTLVETGQAVQSDRNELDWIYTAVATVAVYPGTSILLEARDLPGNLTLKEIIL